MSKFLSKAAVLGLCASLLAMPLLGYSQVNVTIGTPYWHSHGWHRYYHNHAWMARRRSHGHWIYHRW